MTKIGFPYDTSSFYCMAAFSFHHFLLKWNSFGGRVILGFDSRFQLCHLERYRYSNIFFGSILGFTITTGGVICVASKMRIG